MNEEKKLRLKVASSPHVASPINTMSLMRDVLIALVPALCAAVWAVALAGIAIKALWITCPKWFSSVLYIAMGWLCVFAVVPIVNALSPAGFGWLLAGGIIYTAGGVLYALKLPLFNARHKVFGTHEIFHVFVMAGSACHYVLMYFFVMPALA